MLSVVKELPTTYNFNNLVGNKARQYDNVVSKIESIARSMEIIEGLKFVNSEVVKGTDVRRRRSNVDETDFFRLKLNFEFPEEEEGLSFMVTVPNLQDGNYFHIRGVDYVGIPILTNYRPVHRPDVKKDSTDVIVKTLINVFRLTVKMPSSRRSASSIRVFKKNINMSIVLMILSGFNIEEFLNDIVGVDNWERIDHNSLTDVEKRSCNIIMFRGSAVKINTDLEVWQQIIVDGLRFTRSTINFDRALDRDYVLRILGKNYSSNPSSHLEKGEIVSKTIERSLDDSTSELLGVSNMYELFIKEIKKVASGQVIDSEDVTEKRISFVDIVLFPLYKRVSDNVYIYLNSRRKNVKNVFKIREDIILKYLMNSDILQYRDVTSSFDAFINTKISLIPPGTSKDSVSKAVRDIHRSEVGIIDIFSSPNGESTGLSSFMVPGQDSPYVLDENSVIHKKEQ